MGTEYTETFVVNVSSNIESGYSRIGPVLAIFRGDNNRVVLRVFYLDESVRLMDRDRVIPAGPDDPDMILDATIWFFPQWFKSCKSYAKVAEEVPGKGFLDLDLSMPSDWKQLRKEARPLFEKLKIQRGELEFENKKVP